MSGIFAPVVVNALYTGNDRGLAADLFAARGLRARPLAVCTCLVVASHDRVTDVLDVPADTVSAQLEHLFAVVKPEAFRLGIFGSAATVEVVFQALGDEFSGPVFFDLTLSGPSGEDIADGRTREALIAHLNTDALVTVRRRDAELLTSMEIQSLDDAQVAAQRIHRLGARRVLVRCGRLPARFFEGREAAGEFVVDLLFDGEEFALFEAPYLERGPLVGASSVLGLAYLQARHEGRELVPSLQRAKAYTTEALRYNVRPAYEGVPHYFWQVEAGAHKP